MNTQAMVEAAKAASLVQAKALVKSSYATFVATFKDYLEPADLVLLEDIGKGMIAAKVREWNAQTDDEARFAKDEYLALHNGFDALFVGYEVEGGAKVGAMAKSIAHQIVSGTFAVVGAALQAAMTTFVPLAGGIVGAVLNTGIQRVVAYLQGD